MIRWVVRDAARLVASKSREKRSLPSNPKNSSLLYHVSGMLSSTNLGRWLLGYA
jgi:hypothetical protein